MSIFSRFHGIACDGAAVSAGGTVVAAHYGDPLGEQRPARLVIDRTDHEVIAVRGADASQFLTNLMSQVFEGPHGRALNLDAQGHVLDIISWVAIEDGFLLATHPGSSLLEYLQSMIFWSQVTVEEADYGLITLLDKDRESDQGSVAWLGPWREDRFIPSAELEDTVASLCEQGWALAGSMAWDAIRVRALEPEVGKDLDQSSIPHEVFHFIHRAVNLNKGCYRGQETVARVENLGRSPRVLAMVHLDGSVPELPEIHTPIKGGRRNVGILGTVAQDYEYGPIALALIKRSALNSQLVAGLSALAIEEETLVNSDEKPAGRRAVERLRGHVVD